MATTHNEEYDLSTSHLAITVVSADKKGALSGTSTCSFLPSLPLSIHLFFRPSYLRSWFSSSFLYVTLFPPRSLPPLPSLHILLYLSFAQLNSLPILP
jgi:hypothetical protein